MRGTVCSWVWHLGEVVHVLLLIHLDHLHGHWILLVLLHELLAVTHLVGEVDPLASFLGGS